MSAIALVVTDHAVVFACDGVTYNPETGETGGSTSKIALLPELNCIMGSVGAGGFLRGLQVAILQKYESFDDLLKGIAEDCRRTFIFLDQEGHIKGSSVVFVIGGWSEASQTFRSFVVRSTKQPTAEAGGKATTQKPWKLYPIDTGAWVSGTIPPHIWSAFDLDNEDHSSYDMAALLICASRALSGKSADAKHEHYAVGRFVQIAFVDQVKVVSWIAHRWDDPKGSVIDISKGITGPALPISVP